MFTPSSEYSESRPFKIFISLLDKWEIGRPLADVLIYEAFQAIKKLMEQSRDGGDDVSASNEYVCDILNCLVAGYDNKHAV